MENNNQGEEYYLSQEFYNEIMMEAYAEEEKHLAKINRDTERILKAVCNVMGKRYYKSILKLIKGLELSNSIKIVRSHRGQLNHGVYGVIKSYYVSQSSCYPCEDMFYGDVYVKLNKGKYLQIHFSD